VVEQKVTPACTHNVPLNGGPQMVEISRDGKRVFFTNSLYTAWDEQIYPDGIRTWFVKADAGPDGSLTLDPNFFVTSTVFCGATPSSTNSLLSFHPLIATAAVGVHTISHLVIAGLLAWIVYDFIGLALLRRSWINLDLIWCFSLLGAAAVLFLAPLA
jgi:56kDa selenium binding protein (SBP56)